MTSKMIVLCKDDAHIHMCKTITEPPTSNTSFSVLFVTFQYNYFVLIVLILEPKVQYFGVYHQYFASKISTGTEESVRLEALPSLNSSQDSYASLVYTTAGQHSPYCE